MRFAWTEDAERRKHEAMGGTMFLHRGNVFTDPLPSAEMQRLARAKKKAKRRRKKHSQRSK